MTHDSFLGPIAPLLAERYQRISRLYETGQPCTGIPSGLQDLDRLLEGFRPGELTLVAAAPCTCKTSFLLTVAANVTIRQRIATAVFTPNGSANETTDRLLALETRINSAALVRGRLTADNWGQLTGACEQLAEAPLLLNDDSTPTPSFLDTVLDAHSEPPRLLLLDDLHELAPANACPSALIDPISELREIAGRRELAIIATLLPPTQARDPATGHIDLYELRRTALIGAADVLIVLHRNYDEPLDEAADLVEAIVVRNRNGPNDTIKLAFLKGCGRFTTLGSLRTPS